jgi:hypothetical protein
MIYIVWTFEKQFPEEVSGKCDREGHTEREDPIGNCVEWPAKH